MEGEEFDEFCYFLQELDRAYLDLMEQKREKGKKPNQGGNRTRRK